MARRMVVVPYDPTWPHRFQIEAAPVVEAFGNAVRDCYHIGSTSVPGLPAKPTIDILVVVGPGTDVRSYYGRMQRLGFQCRGEGLDALIPGTPGRFYFPKLVGEQHVVHVHVCEEGHEQVAELLTFRDYLRAHPDDAATYGALKTELAGRHEWDNVSYMRGKEDLVRDLLKRAESWSRGNTSG